MKQTADIKKITIIIAAGCMAFFIILTIIACRDYLTYRQTLNMVQQQEAREAKLEKDIDRKNSSIEGMIKEQEEFKKILFEERDVPAFLDGISASAQKALVYVLEMKTQQFSQVNIPKDMEDPNQLTRSSIYQNTPIQGAQDASAQLSDMLTLASMPIHFKIHGTFESIVNFLSSIENYRQLLTVSNVEISSREDYPQLTCEFTLRIYSLKKFKDIQV